MNTVPQDTTQPNAGSRIAAVDALRGLAVLLVLAATGGARLVYSLPRSAVVDVLRVQFRPSAWHGFTLADLCLPAFLFVAGVSLALSSDRRSRAGEPRRSLAIRSLWRGLGLYVTGVVVDGVVAVQWSGTDGANALDTVNLWTGPLQQLAVCIALGGMATTWVPPWQTRTLLCVSLLVAYGVLLAWVPFAGAEAGRYRFEHNLAVIVDRQLLPATGPFPTWDPCGITTTLPAFAILVAGLAAGAFFLQDSPQLGQRLTRTPVGLSAAALACVNASALVTVVQPPNPYLMTPPFALAAMGVMLFALAALLAVEQVAAVARWGLPLRVLGRVSLAAVVWLGVVRAP